MNHPIPVLSESDLARFWSKINMEGECWEWTDYLNKDGYGQLSLDGSMFKAHRISYAIANGDPGDLNVNHFCDNPPCVNPDHLWTGTQQEGIDDMVTKKRQAKGEGKTHSKLTDGQVKEILGSKDTNRILADRHGISEGIISSVKHDRIWKHIEGKRHVNKIHTHNRTGVRGVSIQKDGRYAAEFQVNKKKYWLGRFDTIKEAAMVITKKKLELSHE
jgi:hypothetical protein